MAGLKTIECLLKEDASLYDITIFGSEPYTNYSRIMLSSVLQGDMTFDDITLHDWKWYEQNHITLYPNETVVSIDRVQQKVTTDKQKQIKYDRLIIATGSNPFIIPLPGIDKPGVMTFRTIDDCKKMIDTAKQFSKAAVIGGGLLGLEAARGLLNLGMEVDVIHLSDQLMNNQLDQQAGTMLKDSLEKQGMRFLLEKESAEIYGKDRVEGLHFKDGTSIKTDLIVMAVGVRPNISLAQQAQLQTNRGIIVNNVLKTSDPNIFAVGECSEHQGNVYGLVKPLYEQAEVLAKHLTDQEAQYRGSTIYTQLKISGIHLFSIGQIHETEKTKTIYNYDAINETYKKILFKNDKAIGAVLFGDTTIGPILLDSIKKQKFIPNDKKSKLLQPIHLENSYAAQLPRNENVCTCNSVSKGCIIDRVLSEDLQTVNDVKRCTKASSSCGGCKPVVQELLDYIQSDFFHEKVKDNRFCSCTSYTEDEIVHEIQQQKLTNIDEVFCQLDWKNPHGCDRCIPALHYYLTMIYPALLKDDHFFYLDSKTNACLEADGTYSVTPQFYSGKVTVKQIQQISDVLVTYRLSKVVITSDQRLKIAGIKQKDLLPFCSDLNMSLHSIDQNILKSVQIIDDNVPQHSQAIYDLSSTIEKQTEFLTMPSKLQVKIFNSKTLLNEHFFDLSILATNHGWELIVIVASKQTIFAVSTTHDEIRTFALALIQYYRQSANFNEKIGTWIERAGMIHIREALFDPTIQTVLLENLKKDQDIRKQKDDFYPLGKDGTIMTELMLKYFRDQQQKVQSEKVYDTQCPPYCSMQCKMQLIEQKVVSRKKYKTIGKDNPTSQGGLCVKGMNAHQHALHHDRIKQPLKKINGMFQPISWEEAYQFIADTFQKIQDTDGKDAVAVYGSASITNEEAYLLGEICTCSP